MKSLIAVAVVSLFFASSASAVSIRVSQESAVDAGDFDANVLGYVTAFGDGSLTAASYYSYSASKYNGTTNGLPAPVVNLAQLFFVNTTEGLSLFTVYDAPAGGGGSADSYWELFNDTAATLVSDDGSEMPIGTNSWIGDHNWVSSYTDGFAIGALDNDWVMYGEFTAASGLGAGWSAVTNGGTNLALSMDLGRRIRLDTASEVPEPGALLLLGTGLVGLVFYRKRA